MLVLVEEIIRYMKDHTNFISFERHPFMVYCFLFVYIKRTDFMYFIYRDLSTRNMGSPEVSTLPFKLTRSMLSALIFIFQREGSWVFEKEISR